MSYTILSVVGARPNFMKVAPIHRALLADSRFTSKIVHTGQHYDTQMSDIFFRQLGLPEPDHYLDVGSGSHGRQTGLILERFERVVLDDPPDMILVVGDVNSTLACALVGAKCHIPVVHVEAGLRSGDRKMPEEINRIVTDSIADLLLVSEPSGEENLRKEGIAEDKIVFVGNVMIDSLVHFLPAINQSNILEKLGLSTREFTLVTMHRPVNVDTEAGIRLTLGILERLSSLGPVVFPMHPRTRARLEEFTGKDGHDSLENIILLEPLGYIEFVRLMSDARLVVTDSGGVQEETTFLQVPCLTVRETTERPATVTLGTNRLVPLDPGVVFNHARTVFKTTVKESGKIPHLWDGQTAERIVHTLASWFESH